MGKITLNNIKNFIEGNLQMIINQSGFTSDSYKEQIAYRMLKCEDCLTVGKCSNCGCSLPGRFYTSESCNKDRFPDIMSEEKWIKYKTDNGIK